MNVYLQALWVYVEAGWADSQCQYFCYPYGHCGPFRAISRTSPEVELERERHTICSHGADYNTSLNASIGDANVHPSIHLHIFCHVENYTSGGLGRQLSQ